ncbi:MAG: Spy/CpxP family protein refolding chaperone [Vicinamibacterales bacterium]
MTNRIRLSLAAGLIAITAAAVIPAMAQDGQGPPAGRRMGPPPAGQMGPGGPGGPMGPGGRKGPGGPGGPMGLLGPIARDLTNAQREQVRGIMQSHRDEFKQAGDKMRAAREGMGALIDAETIDESAIRAKSVDVAAAEADAAILNAKVRNEVFGILTPEQVAKAKELKAARPQMRRPGR